MQEKQKQNRELLQAVSTTAKSTETPRTITAEVPFLKSRNASNSRDVINNTSNRRDVSNVKDPATVGTLAILLQLDGRDAYMIVNKSRGRILKESMDAEKPTL